MRWALRRNAEVCGGTAEKGEHAIAVFSEHRKEITLVFIVMMIPIMASQAAIYGLRKMNSELKIIGTSGPNPTGDISLSTQAENDFLLKP